LYFAKYLAGPTLLGPSDTGLAFHGPSFLGRARGRRMIRAEARVVVSFGWGYGKFKAWG